MLASLTPAQEQRLQRLGGEVEDAVTVDAADPSALERLVDWMEHADLHGV